jgi:hypothetical protein
MAVEYIPADTSLEAARVQLEVYRRMPGARRLELAIAMCNTLRRVAADGVRFRHPEYDDDKVILAVARLTLGDALFRRAYPGIEIEP